LRLPRDISGRDLAKRLERGGYTFVRQVGSHIRLYNSELKHAITVPDHKAIRIGTLSRIISDVASNLRTTSEELAKQLFD